MAVVLAALIQAVMTPISPTSVMTHTGVLVHGVAKAMVQAEVLPVPTVTVKALSFPTTAGRVPQALMAGRGESLLSRERAIPEEGVPASRDGAARAGR